MIKGKGFSLSLDDEQTAVEPVEGQGNELADEPAEQPATEAEEPAEQQIEPLTEQTEAPVPGQSAPPGEVVKDGNEKATE